MLLKSENELLRLYPPRTEIAIRPERIASYRGFVAQFKYNDIRLLISFAPSKPILLRSRDLRPVRQYKLTRRMLQALSGLKLSRGNFHLLDGGLTRNLRVGAERVIVLWDILVHDSEYLLGTSYTERYRLLEKICGFPKRFENATGARAGLEISPELWLAPIFRKNFGEHFRLATERDFLEGLVLKSPGAPLARGWVESNNTSWQVKVRKPRADYMF